MKKLYLLLSIIQCCFTASSLFAMPSVYPTGTTIYKPDQCESGYTILSGFTGATLIDMNGKVAKQWEIDSSVPNKILPGGYLLAGMRGKGEDLNSMVQMDWDGNIVWKFDRFKQVSAGMGSQGASKSSSGRQKWSACQHHDFQREGNPVGYYTPELAPFTDKGNTLILAHTTSKNPRINSGSLQDDVIYEVSWEGDILWKWVASEHVDEMGFNPEEIASMQRNTDPQVDWFHANCASYLGPNKWYDGGDERFHPDNIILGSRNANILIIISKKTGKIIWQIGPRYDASPQLKKLGWIIGAHHIHMIPKGLPGAGNIMVFDNGGSAGYGEPNPVTRFSDNRDYSRVIELDPVTLEKVWEYSPQALGYFMQDSMKEYSPYVGGAQRLVNGNTLITEGALGRVIEVTPELEVVWEWVSLYADIKPLPGGPSGAIKQKVPNSQVYRAYRVPYEYIPQLANPKEEAVIPPENKNFKVTGSGKDFKILVQ